MEEIGGGKGYGDEEVGPKLKSKIVCQAKRLAKCLPCQFSIGRMSIVVQASGGGEGKGAGVTG